MPEVLQQPSSTRRLLPGSQKERMPPAPRRLIDVDKMQLVEHDGEGKVYIALSHRWSKKERKAVDIFWSGGPSKDIDFRLLPIKFQNAATVTRRLGIQYLWIDGICINQDKTDVAEEEMREECSRMELIFCSAFCVIAILSEPDSANGFLSQRGTEGIPFNLPGGTEEPSLEIVNKSVDFSRDILEAEWNTRGWTFQERALACHTIYFTKSQAYWECEELTVCESQKHPVTYVLHLAGLLSPWYCPTNTLLV
jgi:hypothetical protein